jgi:hypothetical protein
MSVVETPRGLSPRLRIQLVLLMLIAWEAIGLLAELSFGGPIVSISGDKIDGVLAARVSFGGALVVPLTLYIYALIRGPLRYRGLLWIGVLEQSMVVVFAVYHVVADDITVGGAGLPIVLSLGLVVLLLVNMPREQTTTS